MLTPGAALDEVIASACQKMLLSDRVIGKLARQNMTLCEKIADRIEDFTEKIKAAYEEVDLSDDMAVYHAARAILDFNEEVSERFARALEAATENYNAAQATGMKVGDEGGVKFSVIKEFSADTELEEKNISDGKAALKKLMKEAQDSDAPETLFVRNAMYRSNIGYIDFLWGEPGKGERFKGGIRAFSHN